MSSSILTSYGYSPEEDQISKRLDAIAMNIDSVMSADVLKKCMSFMDLTSLHNEDTPASIEKLVGKVNAFKGKYPEYPLPASICVYPNFAGLVRENLRCEDVHVTTVSGCFPTSQSFLDVKVKECEMAVAAGADEIDIVLALAVRAAGELAGRSIVFKVILETGLLVSPERIAEASFMAMEEGADFIKTSTGKVSVNATPVAASVMCECIKKFYEKTGRKVGFKAAGGISSAKDAACYYMIVKTILGDEWLCKNLFRFGVSRLANALMSAIEQKTVAYY